MKMVFYSVALLLSTALAHLSFAKEKQHLPLPQQVMTAKTIFIDNQTGQAKIGDRAYEELKKWGRFQIASDRNQADLIFLLTAQEHDGGYVTSGGGQTVQQAASEPQNPISPSGTVPAGWQTYTDATYRFAVAYPDEYGIIPEKTPPMGGAVERVRFQDKQLLSTDFADLEPARFTVEVFAAKESSLTDWLRSINRLPAGATTTAVSLAGARKGIRVQTRQQLAPNDFYYFATNKYVYALTPLGMYSSAMLTSFRLL
ncbi:MAG TPA: hypothetical protein VN982_16945 [Candidatus Dormibacteraeota bacterium]|nr:hypothetical protein [Candidatus Dormibacteraeota bacterium]